MTTKHKCRICGEQFELETDPHMWKPLDHCLGCHSGVLSGKILPIVEDGKIIGFLERETDTFIEDKLEEAT